MLSLKLGLPRFSIPRLSTPSSRIERWLGKDKAEELSKNFRGWYGPPVPILDVPGNVWIGGDGDFTGPIRAGQLSSIFDYAYMRLRAWGKRQQSTLNAGFSSLGDMVAEASVNGKMQQLAFNKTGVAGTANKAHTLWFQGGQPAAGSAAGAAPGGTIPTSATTGALQFTNATGGDFLFAVALDVMVAGLVGSLMFYDRLASVTKTMSSSATEAVTGVPTRYTNTTGGTVDSASGNFLMIECRTTLSNTAHNWTTCTYTDQSGNTGATLPSVTGNNSNPAGVLDMPNNQWFCPLASGDTGIKNLTQMQCSSAAVTGAIDFTIGHPLAVASCPILSMTMPIDLIRQKFALLRVFDSACIAGLELPKSAATAQTWTGILYTLAG